MWLLGNPTITALLERLGLLCRWRAGMVIHLGRLQERPCLPPGYQIERWSPAMLGEVAALDYAAYRGSLDARLYWQYFSTTAGCERMWREAVAGKFGRFDPERTLLLYHEGKLCGDVMASVRSMREGFIGNLAVAPEHRGGLGRALLLSCLWKFREAGFDRVGLAVTLDNEQALRLYRALGFTEQSRFPILTRPGRKRGKDRT
jgi:ribosomal protein S18 acetylase RimI-like enzyme